MQLDNVVTYLLATYQKLMDSKNILFTEQELSDIDSQLVSIESACGSIRSQIQNRRALGTVKEGGRTVKSINSKDYL